MIIKRKYFANKENFLHNKEVKDAGKLTMAGSLVGTGVGVASQIINSKESKALDDALIKQKLKKIADNQGTFVTDAGISNNSYYMNDAKKVRKNLAKEAKKHRKKGFKYLARTKTKLGKDIKNKKDLILLGEGGYSNSAILSHELGHSQYTTGVGRSGGKIGKVAHKLYQPSKNLSAPVGIIAGFHSGVQAEKAKQNGKKESKLNRVLPIVTPIVMSAPMLVSEGLASKKGIELLKKSGASKELVNEAKKKLISAGSTYIAKTGKDVISSEAGRLVGKGLVKHKSKKIDQRKR